MTNRRDPAPAGRPHDTITGSERQGQTFDSTNDNVEMRGIHRTQTNTSQAQGYLPRTPTVHEADTAFDFVHGRKGGSNGSRDSLVEGNEPKPRRYMSHTGLEEEPIKIRHLFKRPVIRQWVLHDTLYCEKEERAAAQIELFFDLIMAGVVHTIAEGAAEEASGFDVVKFLLLFFPAWSMWTDVRSFMNVSGTDDVAQRCYLFTIMGLLLGYAANATGIVIRHAGKGVLPEEHGRPTEVETEVSERSLGRRAAFFEFGEDTNLVSEIGKTDYWFAEGYRSAIFSAMAFYLVAKALRLLLYFVYGWMLPRFRRALWLNALSLVVISAIYLPIFFVQDPAVVVTLIICGMLSELLIRYIAAFFMQYLHGRAKHQGKEHYMPAYSLPHLQERMTQFTVLIIGESIISATYVAHVGDYGLSSVYWRALFCLMCAFCIVWIYFDADSSRCFRSALKRHWATSITYTNLHFPLSAALVLLSATFKHFIEDDYVTDAYLWMFSGSCATVVMCIGLMGWLHKSLDRHGSALFPKSTRILCRMAVAGIFAILALFDKWSSMGFLAVHAGLLIFAVAFETIGKLNAVGRVYDPVRAAQWQAEHQQGIKTSKPNAYADWHPYSNLTSVEKGDEDVGIEPQIGQLEARYMSSGEKWAHVET